MGIAHVHSMKRRLIILALFLAGGIVFAIGMIKPHTKAESFQADAIEEPQPDRAEQVMKALAAAYPLRIEKADFQNGDWAVMLDDTWYYYAEGRLLPEELLSSVSEYSPVFFYNYQRELPPWTEPAAEQTGRFRDRGRNNNNGNTPRLRRSSSFQEGLWQASNRDESSQRVEPVNFLSHSVTVHSDIVEILSRVEERIMAAAKTDPHVQSWIANIGEMHGWNWRNVAGSLSRSNHSYGIAIDILPQSLGGKETYWQWASQRGKEWWNIPYEDRYHPPDAVIKTFEAYGFIWGGKWMFFDTMHFEYRPEVFILSGIELEKL